MPKIHRCPDTLLQLNLSGKIIVVTGGNSGVGYETVRQLAQQGADVVLACRRMNEGQKACDMIMNRGVRGKVHVMELDLASLESVRRFSQKFLESHNVLHGLVNNAGVMNAPLRRTREGFELQFGTNHLGHFLLTELLLPALKKGAPSRIVNLSSCFHDKAMGREGKIDFEDPNFERKKYDGWEAYAQSKLANLLHARHLAKELTGTPVVAVSVHPGWVRSNLIQYSMPVWMQDIFLRPILRVAGMLEPFEGAQSTLYALLSPAVSEYNGGYFSQVGIYRDKESQKGGWPFHSPNPAAHDDAVAERLYLMSKKLVGLG